MGLRVRLFVMKRRFVFFCPKFTDDWEVFMKHLSSVLVDNMAILVVLIGVIGAVWPSTLTWVGPHIPWMLGIVMLGMGMTLSVDDFRNVFRRPQLVLIGIFAQFFIMPLVAWALVRILRFRQKLPLASSSSVRVLVGRHRMSFPI